MAAFALAVFIPIFVSYAWSRRPFARQTPARPAAKQENPTCPVCLDDIEQGQEMKLHNVHTICKSCAQSLLANKLQNRGTDSFDALHCGLLLKGKKCITRLSDSDFQNASMSRSDMAMYVFRRRSLPSSCLRLTLPCYPVIQIWASKAESGFDVPQVQRQA